LNASIRHHQAECLLVRRDDRFDVLRRCERHDLACRPDGTCVLCERERPSGGGSRALLIVALVVVAGAAGVIHTQRPRPQPIAALPTETAPAATTPVVETTTTPYRELPPAETMYVPPAVVTETVPGATQPVAPPQPRPTGPDQAALQSAARSVKVVMYTTTWCPQCKKAKAWLNDNGVSYAERDIEASESDRAACKKLNPTCSIPTLDIDGEVIVGYGPSHMRAAIDNAARRRLAK